jgi:DNA mismatch repair protein MutS2
MRAVTAALEFDRVLTLVASFARSHQGRQTVLATLPAFQQREGSRAFALACEVQQLVGEHGTLSFAGIDAATELARSDPDLPALIAMVRRIVEVKASLGEALGLGPHLVTIRAELPALAPFLAYCEQRIGEDGGVLDSASPVLAQARAARERHRAAIVSALEQLARRHPEVSGPFTLRRDRYCLPVPSGDRGRVPGLLLDVSGSGATVFVEPFAVVELNNALAEASARAREEEERILQEVIAAFTRRRSELEGAVDHLAELDAFQARVLYGQAIGGVLLPPGDAAELRLEGVRHPLLDPSLAPLRRQALGEEGNLRPVVPLHLAPPPEVRVVLLSGPNAGGKTVALKTVGLTVLMAQTGIPVLAEAGTRLPPFHRVWCHVGDEQSLLSDLSTFTATMHATTWLLADADEGTLVLYDELGSGTDPEEGAALAAALLEELVRRRCWTLATAHLTTVAAHLEGVDGAVNAAMGFDEASGSPTYRLHLGVPGRSRGLEIASRCGVPASILARARELLSRAFLAIETYLQRLQQERGRLEREREALARDRSEARKAAQRSEEEREALISLQARQRERLEEELARLRERARRNLDGALSELRLARERGEFPGKKRQAAIRHAALDLAPPEEEGQAGAPPPVGAWVRLRGGTTMGGVSRVVGDRVELSVDGKRVWVELSACELVPGPPPAKRVETAVSAEGEPAPELKLIGLTQEEAREELERFLDRALLAGTRSVRVVHGHGSGALRRVVSEVLAHHPGVARHSHPPQARGGTGVTEAELE